MASLGQFLKDQREARHVSLEEIAAATKIVPRYLEALEADRLGSMPGGFFIKGIIRSYAMALGLDPEEVLARYREAGLLSEPDHVRQAAARRTVLAGPVPGPAAADLPTPEAVPKPAAETASPLAFEDAPKPQPSPAARRRIFAVAWRLLAVLAVVAAVIAIWSKRAPREPELKPADVQTRIIYPAPQTSDTAAAAVPGAVTPGPEQAAGQEGALAPVPAATAPAATVPAAGPGTEPQARTETPPAAPESPGGGVTIEIVFEAETWIHVRTDGQPKIDGVFPAGATATARADRVLLIHTGNAGGFTFRLNGRPARRLGRSGQVLTDIKITPENVRDFLEPPASGPATG